MRAIGGAKKKHRRGGAFPKFNVRDSSKYLGTIGKVAGMIDHPYAKTAAKYANIGADVAGKLGYGKKRKHMRGRGGGEDEGQYLDDQTKAREALKKGFSEADVRKMFPHLM